MNKSVVTNGLAFIVAVSGYVLQQDIVLYVGLFALSGALTNWLAIYMLFERVPGLYGSGVIPARFEDFKLGIQNLMMTQFFTADNIDRFLKGSGDTNDLHLGPVIEKVDLSSSFDSLVDVIMQSSFGGMLGMFGGQDALIPLKEPFILNMKKSLTEITQNEEFQTLLRDELEQPDVMSEIRHKIDDIVKKRLDELTPQLVKDIIQEMIKKHLGWLVVWGGVFGGLIGLLSGVLIG